MATGNTTISVLLNPHDTEINNPADDGHGLSYVDTALQMAQHLITIDDTFESITTRVDISFSPVFRTMLAQMVAGEVELRDFGAFCYMAGRISIALGK
jgi:hypothetical protein